MVGMVSNIGFAEEWQADIVVTRYYYLAKRGAKRHFPADCKIVFVTRVCFLSFCLANMKIFFLGVWF